MLFIAKGKDTDSDHKTCSKCTLSHTAHMVNFCCEQQQLQGCISQSAHCNKLKARCLANQDVSVCQPARCIELDSSSMSYVTSANRVHSFKMHRTPIHMAEVLPGSTSSSCSAPEVCWLGSLSNPTWEAVLIVTIVVTGDWEPATAAGA